ncbi:hypothetical protein LPB72_21005 [Hydrogenophaga crassostreae]|uniref:Uncharacterized protein n=1 Tax=Hydrogenophaga crassostreae TaxID=1763535 RepID=A0ABX2U111_9BURK|nr:hypothetical protein LPB72_21005 [Hydrogenophaga crassostreae]
MHPGHRPGSRGTGNKSLRETELAYGAVGAVVAGQAARATDGQGPIISVSHSDQALPKRACK